MPTTTTCPPRHRSVAGAPRCLLGYHSPTFVSKLFSLCSACALQCDGRNGVCPDKRIGGQNDVILKSAERRNGVLTVRYTRPLVTNEPIKDRVIPPRGEVNVIAAIGPLNSRNEANSHAAPDKTTGKRDGASSVDYSPSFFLGYKSAVEARWI